MEGNNFAVPQQQQPSASLTNPTGDERNLAMVVHILSLFSYFLAPLIIYLIKKDESPFIRDHARNALNFQISLFIYGVVSFILAFILIGFVLLFALGILNIVCCIMAAVAANNGKLYKYPMTIPFLS